MATQYTFNTRRDAQTFRNLKVMVDGLKCSEVLFNGSGFAVTVHSA